MQPADADFAQAAVWRVKLSAGVDASRDLRLRVRYTGDVLRAYHADKLLADDFYHARPFEIGLRRYGPAVYQDGLTLKILPFAKTRPSTSPTVSSSNSTTTTSPFPSPVLTSLRRGKCGWQWDNNQT